MCGISLNRSGSAPPFICNSFKLIRFHLKWIVAISKKLSLTSSHTTMLYPMFLYKHREVFFFYLFISFMFSVWPVIKNLRILLLCCCRCRCLCCCLYWLVPVCVFDIHHFSLRRQFQLIYDYFKRTKNSHTQIHIHIRSHMHAHTIFSFIYVYLHMILYAPRKSFSSDERIQAPQIHRHAHRHTYMLFIRCMLILYGKASWKH